MISSFSFTSFLNLLYVHIKSSLILSISSAILAFSDRGSGIKSSTLMLVGSDC